MAENKVDTFLDKSRLIVVDIRSVGIERIRSGETHRTKSKSTYSTQTCVDPKRLAFVNAIRQEDLRSSRVYGIRVPELANALVCTNEQDADQYCEDLKNRKTRFDEQVTLLAGGWRQAVEDHCTAFPDEAAAIREFAPSVAELEERTTLKWYAYPLRAFKATDGSGDFESALSGSLAERAFVEFRAELSDSFDGYGKKDWRPDRFTQAVRSHLQSIARKARSLGPFHAALQQLPDVIEEVLKGVPTQGIISGAPALAIRGLMDILAKPSQAMKYGFLVQAQAPVVPKPVVPKAPRAKVVTDPVIVPHKTASVVNSGSFADW